MNEDNEWEKIENEEANKNQIKENKNWVDLNNKFLFMPLMKIFKTNFDVLKFFIIKDIKIKFDSNNKEHLSLLEELFKNIFPSTKSEGVPSKVLI
jgi:hypothetical protein